MCTDNITRMCEQCSKKNDCKHIYTPVLSCRPNSNIISNRETDFMIFLNENFKSENKEI